MYVIFLRLQTHPREKEIVNILSLFQMIRYQQSPISSPKITDKHVTQTLTSTTTSVLTSLHEHGHLTEQPCKII